MENGDTDSVRNEMEAFLSDIPYTIRSGNKDTKAMERDFQYTFYLFFRMAGGWKVYTEKASSYGRADCIIETTKYIYIFEFKLDGTAKSALQQINRMGYCKPYMADGRKIICIGASFSLTTGTIEDWLTA